MTLKDPRAKKLAAAARKNLIKSEILNFRMSEARIKQLYEVAEKKNVRVSSLLRDWISEKLDHEFATPASSASTEAQIATTLNEVNERMIRLEKFVGDIQSRLGLHYVTIAQPDQVLRPMPTTAAHSIPSMPLPFAQGLTPNEPPATPLGMISQIDEHMSALKCYQEIATAFNQGLSGSQAQMFAESLGMVAKASPPSLLTPMDKAPINTAEERKKSSAKLNKPKESSVPRTTKK